MRRRCVKFSTKKSAYCQKCAFPTIRRIDTPKAAGIPKSADGIDTRFRNRTTIPSAHPNAYAPAGFFVFSCRKENAKNLRGGRQDSPRPCPLCAAHRKSPPDAPTQIGTPCVLFLSLNGRAKSQAARRTETVPHSTNEPTDPNESVSIFMSPASPYAGTHNRSQRSPHRKTDILLSFLCSFIIPLLSIFGKEASREPGARSLERILRLRRVIEVETSDGQTSDIRLYRCRLRDIFIMRPRAATGQALSIGRGWPRRGRVMGHECEDCRRRAPALAFF